MKIFGIETPSGGMGANYFKIAWRNLVKNKVYSFINIFGLAIGLCCFMLISFYVIDELSYDKHFKNSERIFRINSDIKFGGTEMSLAVSSDAIGAALKKDYPQVEQYSRVYVNDGRKFIKKGNEFIIENKIASVDSTFFDLFSVPVLYGNPKTALIAPNTVAISRDAAEKYFGSSNAVGKTLQVGVENTVGYKVNAVFENMPKTSHFNFDFLFSMKNVDYAFGNYLSQNFHTYLLLKKGTDYHVFEKNFPAFIDRYILPQAKQFMEIKSMDEFKKAGNSMDYSLIPLTDIHLKSDRKAEIGVNGNIQYVEIFSVVAVFLLIIACINFMNLSTARSIGRSREVGIRKVLGSERKSLISQFIAESTITAYLAFLIGFGLALLLIPFFNDISSKSFTVSTFFNPKALPFLLLLPLLVGLLAGYYPALFLSAYKPIEVLKSKFNAGSTKSNLRNGLVVFQFSISLILVVGTIIIYQQLNYIRTKNLGFSKDQLINITGTSSLQNNKVAFRNEVLKMPGVKSAAFAGYLPVANSVRSDNTFSTEAVMSQKNAFNMQSWNVDYDYLNTLEMEIVKGRGFSKEFGSDSSAIIINESAMNLMGMTDPIGKTIYTSESNLKGNNIAMNIIGVVKDFHFESMKEKVGALSMRLGNNKWEMVVKIDPVNTSNLIRLMEAKWKAMAPSMPFRYHFVDEAFDDMYRAEARVGKVLLIFAILTIFIACLGLFGLVTYMSEQRTKEIGIRKVLGATIGQLFAMLSKDFMILVLVSIVIAFPIGYWMMNRWLLDYAFKIDIAWSNFVFVAFGAILIALLTVSYQAIKAALTNPVKSLRTE